MNLIGLPRVPEEAVICREGIGGPEGSAGATKMRSDMAKVIVERPRVLGWAGRKPKGYQRQLHRLRDDGPPIREGMKARWQGGTKILNEHLGPLRRYLNSQVGRPWDKVFSEICANINRNSAVQDHVRDHVADYVVTCVILVDGVPCDGGGGRGHGQPLRDMPWRPWYVCPRTGLLQRIPTRARRRKNRTRKNDRPLFIPFGEGFQCRYLDGAWHLIILKPLPVLRDRSPAWDVVLNRRVAEIDTVMAHRHYGAMVYAAGKRRLAKKELRNYPIPVDRWK
jgi:hypothetical protein